MKEYIRKDAVSQFRGKYSFLSNFYETPIEYGGYTFNNNEAAFQAMKNPAKAHLFIKADAKTAKRLGRKVELRADWEEVKELIMYEICLAKFTQNPSLREKLLATGEKYLVEGNSWGDTEWGVCNGKGKNKLGKILMNIREKIKEGNDYERH